MKALKNAASIALAARRVLETDDVIYTLKVFNKPPVAILGGFFMEKKMKRKPKVPKERNAAVMALIVRAGAGSGQHGKTKKAERRAAKISLQKQMDS